MDHSQARTEDREDGAIGFAFFAVLARKNGCGSQGRRFKVLRSQFGRLPCISEAF